MPEAVKKSPVLLEKSKNSWEGIDDKTIERQELDVKKKAEMALESETKEVVAVGKKTNEQLAIAEAEKNENLTAVVNDTSEKLLTTEQQFVAQQALDYLQKKNLSWESVDDQFEALPDELKSKIEDAEQLSQMLKGALLKNLLEWKDVSIEMMEKAGLDKVLNEAIYEWLIDGIDKVPLGNEKMKKLHKDIFQLESNYTPYFKDDVLQEHDSKETVVRVRSLIRMDLESGQTERHNPKYKNILQAWRTKDVTKLNDEDLKQLANCLSQDVTAEERINYSQNINELRDDEGKPIQKAYDIAYSMIANEVYQSLLIAWGETFKNRYDTIQTNINQEPDILKVPVSQETVEVKKWGKVYFENAIQKMSSISISEGLREMTTGVFQSEIKNENHDVWIEENSNDTIVKARRIIERDFQKGDIDTIRRMYDPKLHSILKAWTSRDVSKLTSEDHEHLAHLLSQKVTLNQSKRYSKKAGELRDSQNYLKEDAFRNAYQTIAVEVYELLEKDQGVEFKKKIEALQSQIWKDPNEYAVDVRSDKVMRELKQPLSFLAPGNLLKLALTAWGGAVALLNLIASKGDVAGNPWFWAGLGGAYTGYKELKGESYFNKDIDDWQTTVDNVERKRPFAGAEKINGKEVAVKGMTLETFMQSAEGKSEIDLLKESLKKKGKGAKISQFKKKRISVNTDDGKEKVRVITREGLGLGDGKESEAVTYRRYLLFEALKDVGINNLDDLEDYETAVEMFNRDPSTLTGKEIIYYRKKFGKDVFEEKFNLKHGNEILDSDAEFKERMKNYEADIQAAAKNYKIHPNYIKALIHVESNGHWNASSWTGSLWIMQMTKDIYKENKYGEAVNPLEARKSIDRGTEFLADMINRRYKGNLEKAFTAYNVGETVLDKAVNSYGSNWKSGLSEEGRDYFVKINRALKNKPWE